MATEPTQIPLIDGDTGLETEYAVRKRTADYERQVLEDGQALQEMRGTRGWKLVEGFLGDMISQYTDQLLIETKYDEIRRLQEHVKAYTKVQGLVEGKILEASELAREMAEVVDNQGPAKTGEPEENP